MTTVAGQPFGPVVGPVVGAFDDRVDALLERLRGHAVPDAVFSTASRLGDFSLIWHLIGVLRAVSARTGSSGSGGAASSSRAWSEAVRLSTLLGVESLIVNQGVKRLFRRTRPTEAGDERFVVRRPSTSSFPSGHASSAFFAASVLSSMSSRRSAPLWFGIAAIVATSRPYVRIHHASDVIAGAILGLILGRIAGIVGGAHGVAQR